MSHDFDGGPKGSDYARTEAERAGRGVSELRRRVGELEKQVGNLIVVIDHMGLAMSSTDLAIALDELRKYAKVVSL